MSESSSRSGGTGRGRSTAGGRAKGSGRAKAPGSRKAPAKGRATSRANQPASAKQPARAKAGARAKGAGGAKRPPTKRTSAGRGRSSRAGAKRKPARRQPPKEVVPPQFVMSAFVIAVAITVSIAIVLDSGASAPQVAASGKRDTVKLEQIGKFREPLYAAQAPGDDRRTFVVEKEGRIRVIDDDRVQRRPFLDIRSHVGSSGVEQGLLSIAFDPDYATSRRFYIDYTNTFGNTRIDAYRTSPSDPNRADPSSRRTLLQIRQPDDTHNGGLLLFGPDGHMYIGSGDGGLVGDPMGEGLSRRTLLGKILRIDPRPAAPAGQRPYSIPDDNPFADAQHGFKPEIWAYGLRNPWRFTFDRESGAMLIGDVGQDKWEEIDFLPPDAEGGANFGWSAFEALKRFKHDPRGKGSIKPIHVYRHGPGCSVTGGFVVQDSDLPSLFGRYVYGDFCTGEIRSLVPTPERAVDDAPLGITVPGLSSFAEDNAGHIYATSLIGPVYRLRAR